MNRTTRAVLTGAFVLAAGLTVGGAALVGGGPAPTPASVTVQDPAPGPTPADRDCPTAGATGGTDL